MRKYLSLVKFSHSIFALPFALQGAWLAAGGVPRAWDLTWIVVDDEIGHSRALRWRDTQPIFFPVTMISKRMVAGEKVDIQALYQGVSDQVEALEASYGSTRKPRKKPKREP